MKPLNPRMARRAAAVMATGLVAAPALLTTGGAAAPALAAAPSSTHLVPGLLAGLSRATRTGAAPAARELTVAVAIQRPDTAGEVALYNALYDRSSPLYHHFLSPAQFNRRFGVPAAQTQRVRRFLTGGGLRIETTSRDGDLITAQGTVAQLDRLFHVSIGTYTFRGQRFLANNVAPSIPNGLRVAAVSGLDTVQKFALAPLTHGTRTSAGGGVASTATGPVKSVAATAGAVKSGTGAVDSVGPQAGNQGVLTPQELWSIYDDPGAASLTDANGTSTASTLEASSADLGQGQSIGVFGEGETSSVVAQLRLFESAMGFPKVPVRVVDTEGGPASAYGDNTGAIEWYLDSQASTGMAPDVSKLSFYFAKTLFDADIFADFDSWANDPNGPRQMNASFGECEENPTNPVTGPLAQTPYGTELGDELEAVAEPILRQAAIEGRTLFASAGDNGQGCPQVVVPVVGAGNGVAPQPVPMVNYPCASAYVVCVGGTVVSTNGTTYPTAGQRVAETSWTDGGGGTSYFIPEPSFQKGVAAIDHSCLSTPSGDPYPPSAAPLCRGVPDVADMSGNITGDAYFIYIDGEPSSEGGTSLSSPLMMGQWARVQAGAPVKVQKAGGLGFADPVIYRQAATEYARDFYDVTDSEYGVGNGEYQPGPGWDYASGWGSLNVANFIHDVDSTAVAADKASAPEAAAQPVTTAAFTSPGGNATNPIDVSLGNQDSLDLTGATLTASAAKGITATLSGPGIGSLPPAEAAAGGNDYLVAWLYRGTVYYAEAEENGAGQWSYTSGDTGTYGQSSTYGYNATSGSRATGSVDPSTGTITIHVPASEVGSPRAGDLLAVPQAFDQLNTGALSLTTDSADDLTPVTADGGAALSRGVAVKVGS